MNSVLDINYKKCKYNRWISHFTFLGEVNGHTYRISVGLIVFLSLAFKLTLLCFPERSMNEDERMSDTLSKWERICKGSSVREMKLVFKVSLDHHFQRESLPYWFGHVCSSMT